MARQCGNRRFNNKRYIDNASERSICWRQHRKSRHNTMARMFSWWWRLWLTRVKIGTTERRTCMHTQFLDSISNSQTNAFFSNFSILLLLFHCRIDLRGNKHITGRYIDRFMRCNVVVAVIWRIKELTGMCSILLAHSNRQTIIFTSWINFHWSSSLSKRRRNVI